MSDPTEELDPALWYPPDLARWNGVERWFFREVTSMPSWREGLWANVGDEYLRDRRSLRDTRTIRRMRGLVVARGELERRRVHAGEGLPDGRRATRSQWIYVPGPAMRARLDRRPREVRSFQDATADELAAWYAADRCAEQHTDVVLVEGVAAHRTGGDAGDARPPSTGSGPFGRPTRTISRANEDNRAPGSIDPRTRTKIDRAAAQTSSRTLAGAEPTSFPGSGEPLRAHSPETIGCADAIARHYARTTGRVWKTIHPAVLALLAPFVEQMRGDDVSKVQRACAVLDDVIAQAQAATGKLPSLRYVFHPQIFWKRLERLSAPEASPGSPAPPSSPPPRVPPSQRSSTVADERSRAVVHPDRRASHRPERADPAALRGFLATLGPARIAPEPSGPARSHPGDARATSSDRVRPQRPAAAVPWVEPPECHDPNCRACALCSKHAPLSGALFHDLREAARTGSDAFRREAAEARERALAARRQAQLQQARAWLEAEARDDSITQRAMVPVDTRGSPRSLEAVAGDSSTEAPSTRSDGSGRHGAADERPHPPRRDPWPPLARTRPDRQADPSRANASVPCAEPRGRAPP